MSESIKKESLHVTIPADLLKVVKELSAVEDRNLSNMTAVLLKRGLEKNKAA